MFIFLFLFLFLFLLPLLLDHSYTEETRPCLCSLVILAGCHTLNPAVAVLIAPVGPPCPVPSLAKYVALCLCR
jgi:hypothetical protein